MFRRCKKCHQVKSHKEFPTKYGNCAACSVRLHRTCRTCHEVRHRQEFATKTGQCSRCSSKSFRPSPPKGHRYCKDCKATLPVDCFHRKKHLRHSYCKACTSKRQKVIADKNRAINRERYDTPEWASMLRTCARCRQVKTHAEFARLPSNASGCHAYCRVCYSAWSAERRAKTKGPERDTVSQ